MGVRAILLSGMDNVASLINAVEIGETIEIVQSGTGMTVQEVVARQNIPLGHKIAICELRTGSNILKYGSCIGILTSRVAPGDHVHTHNLESRVNERQSLDDAHQRYRGAELLRFAIDAAERVGAAHAAAVDLATVMVEGDMRGVHTHGIRRLPAYINRIYLGAVDGSAVPEVSVRDSIVYVDGHNAIGHHIACVCVDALVRVASTRGVALAVAKNSNHFGFAGYYSSKIASHGMIGVVISNGTPCVAAPGGILPVLSNDPLSISAPLGEDRFVECDLATTVTSRDNVRQALATGSTIPDGWANGPDGKPTRDPAAALSGTMLALGGGRGFGLIFALEMLTGLLTGGAFGNQVASKDTTNAPEGTGHFLLAIQIDSVINVKAFEARLRTLISQIKDTGLVEEAPTPRFPGERRWRLRQERDRNGIPLVDTTVKSLRQLADKVGVSFPAPIEVKYL